MASKKNTAAGARVAQEKPSHPSLDALEKVLRLFGASGVHELEFEDSQLRVKLTRAAPAPMAPGETARLPARTAGEAHPAQPAAPAAVPAVIPKPEDQGGHLITSPFVGTFYRAPSPTSAVFVQLGSLVKKGQTLCIIEAMKLMNEIEADDAGKVVEICVDNAQPVELGQKLFRIVAV